MARTAEIMILIKKKFRFSVFLLLGLGVMGCGEKNQIQVYTIPAEPAPPESWRLASPSSFEKARFTVSEFEGTANVSLTVLQGDGGGLLENVNRWRGQLGLEAIEEKDLQAELEPVEALGKDARVVDINGTSSRSQLEERLVGVIAPQGELTWFYKLTGTPSVVEKARNEFLDYLPQWR